MKEAFRELTKAINLTGMRERSKSLDKLRTKDYWSTGLEMAARSFESYVIAKLQDQNASNDYLANITSEGAWQKENGYPYPTAGETPAIRAAFDNFFQVVQTKETEHGVAMFSRSQTDFASQARSRIAGLVARVRADKSLKESIDIMPVAQEAVDEAAAHGLDIAGYTHSIDSSAVNHVIKNHGDDTSEARRGQLGITDADFDAIIQALQSPDKVVYGTKTVGRREQIISIKRLTDGQLMVLEEVRTGKEKLALVSMRKYPATKNESAIIRTVLPNAQSDSGMAVSIVENPEPRNTGGAPIFSQGAPTTGLPAYRPTGHSS
ncbi:MAG: LPD1 domain-containing protein [Burkholderiaceae bacterium]|nr:LPD1 domain-containing protein [Burkholderiaceae bacterium]